MIKQYSLLMLQKAVNVALSWDEKTQAKLLSLEGRVIQVTVLPLAIRFYMSFHDQSVLFFSNHEGFVDTKIESSPIGLIRLSFLPASKVRSLFHDGVTISGDVELGQQVKALFDELDIDWEGTMANFTGDVIAYQVGNLVRYGRTYTTELTDSLRHHVGEYLQEERRIFPPREEVSDFFDEVDKLLLEVERLEATFEHTVKTHENH